MYKVLFLFALVGVVIWFKTRNPNEDTGLSGAFGRFVAPKVVNPPPASSPAPPVATPSPALIPQTASPVSVNTVPPHPTPAPSLQPAATGRGVIERKNAGRIVAADEEPPTWGLFEMKYRQVPAGDFAERWRGMGVETIVDPAGRVVSFRGTYAATEALKAALAAMDTVPGSCCLQAWTVYVDRRVSRGFDLAAALGAATGGDTSLKLGAGGLVLDVGADRIAAALSVIADGGAVDLVQCPYVRLVDAQAAKVESIQEVPIPETVVANGVAQTSIRFRKVGLQLDVTPTFLGDRVRLLVNQQNGVVGSAVKVGENEVPVIQSQTVASTAELTVGQTLVLGGVRSTRKTVEKGLLGKREEETEGSLYVILSTYSDEPRAVPVRDLEEEFPAGLDDFPPPLTVPGEGSDDWLTDGLLPPKDWKAEERDFVRSKGGK